MRPHQASLAVRNVLQFKRRMRRAYRSEAATSSEILCRHQQKKQRRADITVEPLKIALRESFRPWLASSSPELVTGSFLQGPEYLLVKLRALFIIFQNHDVFLRPLVRSKITDPGVHFGAVFGRLPDLRQLRLHCHYP